MPAPIPYLVLALRTSVSLNPAVAKVSLYFACNISARDPVASSRDGPSRGRVRLDSFAAPLMRPGNDSAGRIVHRLDPLLAGCVRAPERETPGYSRALGTRTAVPSDPGLAHEDRLYRLLVQG